MAHTSKAIYPKDDGGSYGQRIAVSVQGNLNWGLRVGAFVTGRVSSSDWLRYSLVVLNCKLSSHYDLDLGERFCREWQRLYVMEPSSR